jgi:hypothetical protein
MKRYESSRIKPLVFISEVQSAKTQTINKGLKKLYFQTIIKERRHLPFWRMRLPKLAKQFKTQQQNTKHAPKYQQNKNHNTNP